jgi:hypothetical protein
MSTRDQGARRGAASPTAARNGDLSDAAAPYTPPAHSTRPSAPPTGPIIEQHTERPSDERPSDERPSDERPSDERRSDERRSDERVANEQFGDSRDRVRWGPIWAGAAVVLTTFIVLQLLFFALGWLDLGFEGGDGAGVTAGIVTGALALIAFFVGGLTAGASTMWRKAGDGMLHGVLVWALSVLGILALALIGGSALLGPLASFASQAPDATQAAQNVDPAQALNTARDTAGWTALGLGAALAAAAIGGIVGSKIWPGRENVDAEGRIAAT